MGQNQSLCQPVVPCTLPSRSAGERVPHGLCLGGHSPLPSGQQSQQELAPRIHCLPTPDAQTGPKVCPSTSLALSLAQEATDPASCCTCTQAQTALSGFCPPCRHLCSRTGGHVQWEACGGSGWPSPSSVSTALTNCAPGFLKDPRWSVLWACGAQLGCWRPAGRAGLVPGAQPGRSPGGGGIRVHGPPCCAPPPVLAAAHPLPGLDPQLRGAAADVAALGGRWQRSPHPACQPPHTPGKGRARGGSAGGAKASGLASGHSRSPLRSPAGARTTCGCSGAGGATPSGSRS